MITSRPDIFLTLRWTLVSNMKFITCYCSHEYETVEQQGKKTWSFYRYSLTIEYEEKPPLAPPLIVINLLWRAITLFYRRLRRHCCAKNKNLYASSFLLYIIVAWQLLNWSFNAALIVTDGLRVCLTAYSDVGRGWSRRYARGARVGQGRGLEPRRRMPVSYTHLTLPTKRIV